MKNKTQQQSNARKNTRGQEKKEKMEEAETIEQKQKRNKGNAE